MCASTTRTYLYVGNYKITTNIELQELNLSGNFIGDNEIVEREWVTWVFEFLVKFYSSTKFVLKSMYGMNLRIMISLNWISVTHFSVRSFGLWVVFANEDKEKNASPGIWTDYLEFTKVYSTRQNQIDFYLKQIHQMKL